MYGTLIPARPLSSVPRNTPNDPHSGPVPGDSLRTRFLVLFTLASIHQLRVTVLSTILTIVDPFICLALLAL